MMNVAHSCSFVVILVLQHPSARSAELQIYRHGRLQSYFDAALLCSLVLLSIDETPASSRADIGSCPRTTLRINSRGRSSPAVLLRIIVNQIASIINRLPLGREDPSNSPPSAPLAQWKSAALFCPHPRRFCPSGSRVSLS
jgi:hypothetical protein